MAAGSGVSRGRTLARSLSGERDDVASRLAGTGEHDLFINGNDYQYVLHYFVTPTLD